ncbi:MAG: hypothetical protein ACC656_06250 [Candidatus Heimdallarchaeota archaeon]
MESDRELLASAQKRELLIAFSLAFDKVEPISSGSRKKKSINEIQNLNE